MQTGILEITGLRLETLKTLAEKAQEVGATAEEYARTLIERGLSWKPCAWAKKNVAKRSKASAKGWNPCGKARAHPRGSFSLSFVKNRHSARDYVRPEEDE